MASTGAFTFEKCDQDAWDKIFGEWTPEKFRQAKEELEQPKDSSKPHLVAIHGDDSGKKIYGGFDHGLGVHIDPTRARAHRREVMKEKGVVECG